MIGSTGHNAKPRSHPLFREVIPFAGDGADLFEIVRGEPAPLLLEDSTLNSGRVVVGLDPWSLLTWTRGAGLAMRRDGTSDTFTDPFDALRHELSLRGADDWDLGDSPAVEGGFLGYFGYGVRTAIEQTPDELPDSTSLPDMRFGLYDLIMTMDGAHPGSVTVIGWGGGDDTHLQDRLLWLRGALSQCRASRVVAPPTTGASVQTDITCGDYEGTSRLFESSSERDRCIRSISLNASECRIRTTLLISIDACEPSTQPPTRPTFL